MTLTEKGKVHVNGNDHINIVEAQTSRKQYKNISSRHHQNSHDDLKKNKRGKEGYSEL